jgi:uncharacterized membrane protein YccC
LVKSPLIQLLYQGFQFLSIHQTLLNDLSEVIPLPQSSQQTIFSDNPSLLDQDLPSRNHIQLQDNSLNETSSLFNSFESASDQIAQIEQLRQALQELNQDYLYEISKLELELIQFKNPENSSSSRGQY